MPTVLVEYGGVTAVVANGTPVAVVVGATGSGNATQIRSRAIATAAPADGDVLLWDAGAAEWAPGSALSGGVAFADITGTLPWARVSATPTTLAGYGITDAAGSAALAAHLLDLANPHAVTKSQVGLAAVENTALSTWTGSANLTTVGTLVAGSVPASLLTGTTLPAGIVTSSLTAVGTLVAGAVPASLVTAGTFGAGAFVFQGLITAAQSIVTGVSNVFGHTATVAISNPNTPGGTTIPGLEILTLGVAPLGLGRWSTAGAGSSGFVMARSKGATIGSVAAVVSGDRLAQITIAGDDGTDLGTQAAALRWEVAGAVTTNRVPGRMLIMLAAGTADDDVAETARFTTTGLSLGTTTAPTVAGSLAAIGTGRFGPAAISAGAHLEANLATGTATLVPVTISLTSTSNGNDWANGTANTWGNLNWRSEDGSVTAAPVRARIAAYQGNTSGTLTGLAISVGTSGSALSLTLTLAPDLSAAFVGSVAIGNTLTVVAPGAATHTVTMVVAGTTVKLHATL